MINRGKRSKTLSEVKPVENINKNLQSFPEINPVQKEVDIYLLKKNNENNKTWSKIYWKFKHHSKVIMIILLLILNKYQNFSIVFIADIEQLNIRLLM